MRAVCSSSKPQRQHFLTGICLTNFDLPIYLCCQSTQGSDSSDKYADQQYLTLQATVAFCNAHNICCRPAALIGPWTCDTRCVIVEPQLSTPTQWSNTFQAELRSKSCTMPASQVTEPLMQSRSCISKYICRSCLKQPGFCPSMILAQMCFSAEMDAGKLGVQHSMSSLC